MKYLTSIFINFFEMIFIKPVENEKGYIIRWIQIVFRTLNDYLYCHRLQIDYDAGIHLILIT